MSVLSKKVVKEIIKQNKFQTPQVKKSFKDVLQKIKKFLKQKK